MKSKKILIVDDQKFAVQMLRDTLAPQGFIIEAASDGVTACKTAAEFQPDLILMDLVMPGMDGVETCRRIKQDSHTSSIPVIVITASKNKESLVAAFEAGADDYMTKPVSDGELLARINSNLMRRESLALLEQKAKDSEVLLEISQAVNSTLNPDEILRIIVDKLADNLDVERCSIVMVDEDGRSGHVLASSDTPGKKELTIDLERYPEIREAIRTGKTVIVGDVKNHPLMEGVKERISGLDFNTVLVLPVVYRREMIGKLILRTTRGGDSFTARELRFCKLVANISAGALKNARHYQDAREESHELREVKGRLERELREKEVFETLFAHASEGLMVLNVRGEPFYINRGALDILGYSRSEALNITLPDFLDAESYQDAMENHVNFFLGRDYRKKQDLVFRTKSGEKRFVTVAVSDHRLHGDYAIISFMDVTEEMMAMQQLREANERLLGFDHLKSEYINTATHELRIPVTVIHSYCSLIKEMGDDNLTDEQRSYLAAALESSERLTELVNDMLDISKLDAGKEEMNFEEKSIMEPIREVYTVLAPFASKNGLDMYIEPIQENVSACFDSAHIRCVLTNLIGNAIKFTPRGGKIGISAARDGDDVHVSVTDTGEGIPENYVSRIFDEFCQVKPHSGSKRGTGLGLAICKRIVTAHNGKMWVQSAPRKGSRFTFSIPASRD